MSEGWERKDWRLDEARSRRLPQVQDLPQAGEGYDRAAVEAAFESFYRHAAEVDRTLDVLESVSAFQREAGALRADIRALRAASWGPVPTLRHTVATTGAGRVDRRGAPLDAWPRIALYSAFIIFVAVGSAVADLSSGAIVALVIASWLVVGVAELAVSGIAGRAGRASRGYPGWAGEETAAEPESVAEAVVEPAAAPEPEAEAEGAEQEAEPEEARAWRPWGRPEEPVAEPDAEAEPLPEPVAAAESEVDPEPEPDVEPEPEPEVEPEPAPVAEAEREREFVPTLEPFGEAPEAALQPAEIIPEVAPFEEPEPEAEAEPEPEPPELEPQPEPVVEAEPEPEPEAPAGAAEPERGRRRRFWRRRTAEEPAALEPLPEPRHVRLVDVEQPPAEEEAEPPVRESEPVEGGWGTREVPPTTRETASERTESEEDPEPQPQPEPEPEPEPERLDDTDERPAVAVAPSPLRLRRGRR